MSLDQTELLPHINPEQERQHFELEERGMHWYMSGDDDSSTSIQYYPGQDEPIRVVEGRTPRHHSVTREPRLGELFAFVKVAETLVPDSVHTRSLRTLALNRVNTAVEEAIQTLARAEAMRAHLQRQSLK